MLDTVKVSMNIIIDVLGICTDGLFQNFKSTGFQIFLAVSFFRYSNLAVGLAFINVKLIKV